MIKTLIWTMYSKEMKQLEVTLASVNGTIKTSIFAIEKDK